MLAARYLGPDRLETLETPLPLISDEEALIKVEACGFCGSDLGIVAGVHPRARAPLTLGHEFSGTIAEIRSSGRDFEVGDRVTAYPLISCGRCFACRSGQSHVCRTLKLYGIDVDGAMAEFVRVSVGTLIKIPVSIPPLVGAVIEPLAVAVHSVSMAPTQDVHTIVILGAGPIGLLTGLVASSRGGAKVLISDVLPSRIELARQLGLTALSAGEEVDRRRRRSDIGRGGGSCL